MGLEGHVNEVLVRAGMASNEWYWSNGLRVSDGTWKVARKIIDILEDSEEFGPAIYDYRENKIKFGTHRDFFTASKKFPTYGKYWIAFKTRTM